MLIQPTGRAAYQRIGWQISIKVPQSGPPLPDLVSQVPNIVGSDHCLDVCREAAATGLKIEVIMGEPDFDTTINPFSNVRPVSQVAGTAVDLVHDAADNSFASLKLSHNRGEHGTAALGARSYLLVPGTSGELVSRGVGVDDPALFFERGAVGRLLLGRDPDVCDVFGCHRGSRVARLYQGRLDSRYANGKLKSKLHDMETAVDPTNIWEALDNWGKSLPPWQRFIVSIAARDGKLNDEQINQAYDLYLAAQGLIPSDLGAPRAPKSITGRSDNAGTASLVLKQIRNLTGVNAIPNSSILQFGMGLTVIYGHNGAGKSGFARILAAACFSRAGRSILPNAYDRSKSPGAAADISVQIGSGPEQTLSFTPSTEHPILRRISVFDSGVATVHLNEETPLGFQPTGFDVFDEVARVITTIIATFEVDIGKRRRENKFDAIFLGDSPVRTEIAKLSKDTDLGSLRTLATHGASQVKRQKEIDAQLLALTNKSPAELIKIRQDARRDIAELKTLATSLAHKLDLGVVTSLRAQMGELQQKVAQAASVSLVEVGNQSLRATGKEAWEPFAKAARALGATEKAAYPTEGDPCLLCHRPLDGPSATLIRRFWSFLDDASRLAVETANTAISRAAKQLEKFDTTLLATDSRIRSELMKLAPELVGVIDLFCERALARKQSILTFMQEPASPLPSDDFLPPITELTTNDDLLQSEIEELQKGSVESMIMGLRAEHVTLRHREVLAQNVDDICAYVLDLQWIDKATMLRRSLTTRFITDKQRELFQKLIEGRYRETLNRECGALDARLPIQFTTRGTGGKTIRGLQIEGGHKPTEILSEGEQRAVALADFLTEIGLNPTSAGIILDDPVTSLDHKRKAKIAKRLAAEAKVRQVIVFTHDLVFLSQLLENSTGTEVMTHWIDRGPDDTPGNVNLNECPANSDAYKTTHRAKEFLAKARKVTGQARVDGIRAGAAALRNTLEEVIIRDLLNGTVRRWDEQVRINNLSSITWSNEVADEICLLQAEISRLIDAHSTSDEFGGGQPEADQLDALIQRVDKAQATAKMRRKL